MSHPDPLIARLLDWRERHDDWTTPVENVLIAVVSEELGLVTPAAGRRRPVAINDLLMPMDGARE
jgi:hypothetical protein